MTDKHEDFKDGLKPADSSSEKARSFDTACDRPSDEASLVTTFETVAGLRHANMMGVAPLLTPFPMAARGQGRGPRSEMVERLQIGCSVSLKRAYLLLREGGASAAEAEEYIDKRLPRSLDYVERIANGYLRETDLPLTAIDQLMRALFARGTDLLDALVETARLCSVGLNHAERVAAVAGKVTNAQPYDATNRLLAAFYSLQRDLAVRDVIVVSACANIRGDILWPRYLGASQLIELARFAAKLIFDSHRPAAARRADLHPALFPVADFVLELLAKGCAFEKLDDPLRQLCRLMQSVGGVAELRALIAMADGKDKPVTIGAGRPQLSNIADEFD
jgi:hypothetical protein